MRADEKLNILLVDDQPAKLMRYEAILSDIDENLIKASSGREALEFLLKMDVAVVLMDVCMPELDGFELAAMIRDHPRFQKTAIIFVSAIHLTDVDRLRGYDMGAVDYVPVPVIPEVLRAKVKIFAELYRKSRQLGQLNAELERRVADRTAELEQSNRRFQQSEDRRNLALAAGKMGSWDWDMARGDCVWDGGQRHIFGVDPVSFVVTFAEVRKLIHRDDWRNLCRTLWRSRLDAASRQLEFRVCRPDGSIGWCLGTAAASRDAAGRISRISGVTIDITDRKEAEERQLRLAREVDHRAKNALAVVQAVVSLTRADNIKQFVVAVEGRIQALARTHNLLSESQWRGVNIAELVKEEVAPFRAAKADQVEISGQDLLLEPATAQALAVAVHELTTNAARYGALSQPSGSIHIEWELEGDRLELRWRERGGPPLEHAAPGGFGIRVIKATIESQLGGVVKFEWPSGGLGCKISLPHRVKRPNSEVSQGAIGGSRVPASRQGAGADRRRRVLLVEDESLIAMMMDGMLREIGLDVVGPFGSVSDALAALEREAVDSGIVDINLGGEMAFPIASALQARRVPFIFMTGYNSEKTAARFPTVRVIQKPIESEMLRDLFLAELGETPPTTSAVRVR
jgi:two-component sensor histidine kinase/response regulator RpfG family c-di-GMP phosphodiesterase